MRALLDERLRIFQNGTIGLLGAIYSGDLRLNTERAFKLWLNAFEYHRDSDKKAAFEQAVGGPLDLFAVVNFRRMLSDKAIVVLQVASLVSEIENAPSNRLRKP